MEGAQEKSPRRERTPTQLEVVADRSPTRCPFCHDACGPEDERARVCQQCLSRHHASCWTEGGEACASCGSKRSLAPARPEVKVTGKELELLRRGLPQDAVERLQRRTGTSEAEALRALLGAASEALVKSKKGLSDNATMVLLLVPLGLFFMIWMIVSTVTRGH